MLTDHDISDSLVCAEDAGLCFVTGEEAGFVRRRRGKGFTYLTTAGKPVKNAADLARIRSLAIPPAWTDVWICPRANGHIQATGRDARRRKQYLYHPGWTSVRDEAKFERLIAFAKVLPRVRGRIEQQMAERGLGREKVIATVLHLLDATLIRVGNPEYARNNNSFGLTTLQDHHVACNGSALRFDFRGKSGKQWRLRLENRRVARIVKSCQDLPGQHLFQYRDEAGEPRQITSTDVNAYLREAAGIDATAKDFRTWAGTVLAAVELANAGPAESKTAAERSIRAAIKSVADRLGNTVAVCRKCYVHPDVLDAYREGVVAKWQDASSSDGDGAQPAPALPPHEQATLSLLETRQRVRSRA